MRRSRPADEQILMVLRQAEGGTTVADICREFEIIEGTFYRWKKQFAGRGVSELRDERLDVHKFIGRTAPSGT